MGGGCGCVCVCTHACAQTHSCTCMYMYYETHSHTGDTGGMGRSASHPPPTSEPKAVTSSVKQKGSNTTERQRRHTQPNRKWSVDGGKGRKGRKRDREEKEEPLHSTPVERGEVG